MSQHHDSHEGPTKTPAQRALSVFFTIAMPAVLVIMLADAVPRQFRPASSGGMSEQLVAERLRPVAQVALEDASAPKVVKTGEQVYQAQCVGCHGNGAVGAPKFGDAAAWGPRVATGFDALLTSALKGKGAMTAQGGGSFSDYEVSRAVVYMANKGGAKFEEPKAPAAQ